MKTAISKLTKKYQATVPAVVRKKLSLNAGDSIAFDVVVVPFPFTDSSRSKKRPALVLSAKEAFGEKSGHTVLAMITSAKNTSWPLDTTIEDLG